MRWQAPLFLAYYYEGRWRPRSAYAMGLIFRWARLAPAERPQDTRLPAQSHPADGTRRLTSVEKAIVAGGLMLLSAGVLGYARTRRR